jgi:hypothetical protein
LLNIHRAIFGEVRGAHDLITSSPGTPETVLSDLASHYTDRLLPTEIPWQPYSCGFALRGYYVVTRTFSVKATRGGMVQTHAAIVPVDALDRATIGRLLRSLPREAQAIPLATRILSDQFSAMHDAIPTMPAGYPSLVRMLLDGRVPIWLGQQGFEEVVEFLWWNLWPEARRELKFRISAEPNDLKDFPATLICIPVELRGNWKEEQFVTQTMSTLEHPSLCESYLLGLPDGRQFGELRDRLGFSPPQITGLKRLEQYSRMVKEDTVDSVRAAVRLLNVMIPQPEQAVSEKAQVLEKLIEKTIGGSELDLLALRNLDVSGFATGQAGLRNAITGWLRTRVFQDQGGTALARAVLLESHPWKFPAERALIEAFVPWGPDHARSLWHWWETDSDLVIPSEILIRDDVTQAESDFVHSIPSEIHESLRSPLLTICRNKKWCILHSAVLVASPDITPTEKFRSQLEIEVQQTGTENLHRIATQVGNGELMQAALIIQDARLFDLAGEAVKREPTLLQDIDATNPAWRAIWTSAIERGHKLFDGVSEPSTAAYAVLDAVIAGSEVAPKMLQGLAISPSSRLAMYSRRKDLWSLIPAALRAQSLRVAAEDWLKRFLANPEFDPSPLELEFEPAVLAFWRSAPSRIGAGSLPGLWQRFSSKLSEVDFLSWLNASGPPLTQLEAVGIGRFIDEKGWHRSIEELTKLARHDRPDLRPAVYEVWGSLDVWDRLYFAVFTSKSTIHEDEWWDSWVDLSSRLYPHGIEENGIWVDADGDVSRVRGETGREQWKHALDLLRKGGTGGTMTVEGLLHQMRNDFYGNAQLQLLEDLYLSRIRWQR